MESAIVRSLGLEFEPMAVVWSNTNPGDAVHLKRGKFG